MMHISIPQPCHEDWSNMSPCARGRHCGVCEKTVVDLDALSIKESAALLAGTKNVCGRIRPSRMAYLNMLLPLLAVASPALAQEHAATDTAVNAQQVKNDTLINIKGTLTDSETCQPLVGAIVYIYREDDTLITGNVTDVDGRYEIQIAPELLENCAYHIAFTFLGYEPKRIMDLATSPGNYYYPMELFANEHSGVMGKKAERQVAGEIVLRVEVVKFPTDILLDFFLNGPSLFNR